MSNRLVKIAKYLQDAGLTKEAQQILSIATMTDMMRKDLEEMKDDPTSRGYYIDPDSGRHIRDESGAARAARLMARYEKAKAAAEKRKAQEEENKKRFYGVSRTQWSKMSDFERRQLVRAFEQAEAAEEEE